VSEHVQPSPETAQDRPRRRSVESIGKWKTFDPDLADKLIEETRAVAQQVAQTQVSVVAGKWKLVLHCHDTFLSLISHSELDTIRLPLDQKAATGLRLPDEIAERFKDRGIPLPSPSLLNFTGGFYEFFHQEARVEFELSTTKEATEALNKAKNAAGVDKHRWNQALLIALDMKQRDLLSGEIGINKVIAMGNAFKKSNPTLAFARPVKPPTKAQKAAKAELAAAESERAKQIIAIRKTPSAIASAPAAAPGIDPFGDPIMSEAPAKTTREPTNAEAPAETAPEATQAQVPAETTREAVNAAVPVEAAPEATQAETNAEPALAAVNDAVPVESAPEATRAETNAETANVDAPAATSLGVVKAEVPEEWFSFKDGFRQSVSKKPVPFKLTKAVRTEFRLPDTTDKEVVFRGVIKAGVLLISVVGVQA
jgi:hypothetical protein